ncbi:MAG: hypothetical protein U1F36_19400 [Planctomycetota bacterium]
MSTTKTVCISSEDGAIELERADFGAPGTPSDDDILLNVSVRVRGYAAHDQAWIVGSDWAEFLKQMGEVDRTRRGRARLQAASPDDLELEVYPTDLIGHFAVRGHVGRRYTEAHRLRLEFDFPFEPDRLPYIVEDLRNFADRRSTHS